MRALQQRAALRRPKTFEQLCKACFFACLEDEVHTTITSNELFKPGERVAIAASGGKDSTVLAHLLTLLNARHNYGLDLFLLSIDEGISGYRDDSLETVKRNEQTYGIPLKVLSYKELYGWSMDQIVAQIGTKNNCTFCGVFRRQALDRGGVLERADKIATGHNADDIAETILLNIIRGDVPRLSRCTNITTGGEGPLPRVKPFKYTYEKEIVMYAYFAKLDYFSTECLYAPYAARGFARDFVKDLEAARPSAIMDLIHSAESWRVAHTSKEQMPTPKSCERCGFMSSQAVCKACVLLEGLNSGLPNMGIGRVRRGQQQGGSGSGSSSSRPPIQLQLEEDGDKQQQQQQQKLSPPPPPPPRQQQPKQQPKQQQQAKQRQKQQQQQQQGGGEQQEARPPNRKQRRQLLKQMRHLEAQEQQDVQQQDPHQLSEQQPQGTEAPVAQEPVVQQQQQQEDVQQLEAAVCAAHVAQPPAQEVQAATVDLQRMQLDAEQSTGVAAKQQQEQQHGEAVEQ